MRTKIALAILCAGLLLMECVNSTGGSTETSSKVAGVLYNDNGTRAAGAKVACIPRKHNPYTGANSGGDSTVTDDTGAYKFKTMAADTYDILASKDSSMAYRDPVVVTNDQNTYVPPDTLRPAGSIRGVVRFEEGGDPSTIFILFFGTRTFTWPDDAFGNFTSGNMAAGQYRVRILTTTPDYLPANDTFDVRAGQNDVLPDTIVLQYTGIPVPRGLQIQYDTMKQIVSLSWNRPVSGRPLMGYNIYRKHQDSALVLLKSDWADTVYHDSSGIQDITYEYRVAAIDTNTMEGTRSTIVSVTVTSAFQFVMAFSSTDGQFYSPEQMAFDSAGNIYVLVFFSDTQCITKIYKFKSDGSPDTAWVAGKFPLSARYHLRDIEITHDTVFVLDQENKRIKLYSTNGDSLSAWPISVSADPLGFTIKNGLFYIADHQTNKILKYSSTGDSISSWASFGGYNLRAVKCIATAATTDNLYLLDADSVGLIIDTAGNMVSQFSIDPRARVMAGTQWIILSNGNLMYAGVDLHKVFVIDTTGQLVAKFGAQGTADGLFNYPVSAGESPDNRFFVSDAQNSRIQVFRR